MRGLLGSGPGGSATCAKAPRPEAVSAPHSVPQGSTQSPRREGLESKLDQSLGQHFGVNMYTFPKLRILKIRFLRGIEKFSSKQTSNILYLSTIGTFNSEY